MNLRFERTAGAAALAAALTLAPPTVPDARADTTNCTTIASLPRTISASGHYCLAANLSWAGTSGSAITVNRSNVTIDCNGYGIEHVGSSTVNGIHFSGRSDVEIRNCTIKNFHRGIYIVPGTPGSQRVRISGNTVVGARSIGIQAQLRNGLVLGNRVLDTGGNHGMHITVDAMGVVGIRENIVRGVAGTGSSVNGIYVLGGGRALVDGNHISNVGVATTTTAAGIRMGTASTVTPLPAVMRGNHIFYPSAINNIPVVKLGSTAKSLCRDFVVVGAWGASSGCL